MDTAQVFLISALLFAALLDTILSATWAPSYFRYGIPVFVRRYPATPQWEPALPASSLEGEFSSSCVTSLAFKELSKTEYAFRESILRLQWLRYVLVMHGLIQWDYPRSQLTVTGRLSFFPLAFLLASLPVLAQGKLPWSAIVFLGSIAILALSYAAQAFLYGEVGKHAARKWSELHYTFGADA